MQRVPGDLVEDVVRVERAVVAADAGVVAADDLVRAAVILAEQRVQQRLARPGVAHVERIPGLHDGLLHEVVLGQHGDGLVRTSAGMSPGFSAPSSECTSTPSQTSIATLARYSCDRCMGLRVWKAAIFDQPSEVNSARVSAGVMNSAPYLAA